jgi:hypothetical protein
MNCVLGWHRKFSSILNGIVSNADGNAVDICPGHHPGHWLDERHGHRRLAIAMGANMGKRVVGEGVLNRSSSNCSRRLTVWRDKGSCSVGHCQPGWYTRS